MRELPPPGSPGIFRDRHAHPAVTPTPYAVRAPRVGTRHAAPSQGSGCSPHTRRRRSRADGKRCRAPLGTGDAQVERALCVDNCAVCVPPHVRRNPKRIGLVEVRERHVVGGVLAQSDQLAVRRAELLAPRPSRYKFARRHAVESHGSVVSTSTILGQVTKIIPRTRASSTQSRSMCRTYP